MGEEKEKEKMSNEEKLIKIEIATDIITHYAAEVYWWRMMIGSNWYKEKYTAKEVIIKPAFGIDIVLPKYMAKIVHVVKSSCNFIKDEVKNLRAEIDNGDFSNGAVIIDTYNKVCDTAMLEVAKYEGKMEFMDKFYPLPDIYKDSKDEEESD